MFLPKYFKIAVFLLFIVFTLTACSTEPQAIEYNLDQCAECKMMISDHSFGAELVTKKGKIYKYDAAECMISAIKKNTSSEYEHILVTDFNNPKHFIDAKTATFLISLKRPSPMGANLSAYKSKNSIEDHYLSEESQIFDWEQIMNKL